MASMVTVSFGNSGAQSGLESTAYVHEETSVALGGFSQESRLPTVTTNDSRDERRDHGRTDEQHAGREFNIVELQ